MIGTTLGHYRVVELIGEGGTAEVHRPRGSCTRIRCPAGIYRFGTTGRRICDG